MVGDKLMPTLLKKISMPYMYKRIYFCLMGLTSDV